jgi:hypothetical protein
LDAQLNVLTTWLSRSKNCPLSLSFEMERHLVSPKLPRFMAALISQSECWEHIILTIPFNDLRWLDRPFPLLRDLTFGPTDDFATEDTIMVFGDAPQLRSVDLGVMFDPSRVVLPWSQLTSIAAVKIEPALVADILQQATALVKFACTLWVDNTVLGAVPLLIHLESLILRACDWPRTQKLLLDALTAPALRHLTVAEFELGDEPLSTITAFLSRSRCSLQSLHVAQANLPKTAYCTAFPLIPIINVDVYVQGY